MTMQICGGIIPSFHLPRTKPFDFGSIFPAVNEDTVKNLAVCSALRAEMQLALEGQNNVAAQAAIEQYLPALLSVMRGIESCPKDTHSVLKPFSFKWTSSFARSKKDPFYTLYTIRFEVAMTMSALALASANQAAATLDAVTAPNQYEDAAKQALPKIKEAASVFNFIAEHILPLKESLPYDRPPEVLPGMHAAMSCLYRATGQQVASKQAALKSMSPALLSKLYMAAAKLMRESDERLKGLTNDYKDLQPPLKTWAGAGHLFLLAVSLRYLGIDTWNAQKHGAGLGMARAAKMNSDKAVSEGILQGASRSLAARVDEESSSLDRMLESWEKDNKHVYFENVQKPETLPEGKTVTAADCPDFTPPAAPFEISFEAPASV
mmetsp:Transcript_42693/g.100346  ORF Transcript_42693/g.100346 Transcript_42693/m.100346 type:complete len:379 (-) Transcript_42693:487-1623(-)